MSVELLLVPLALAAAHAVGAVGGGVLASVGDSEAQREACVVQTRLKHPGLLVEALGDLGATITGTEPVSGTFEGMSFSFIHHEDGTLSAHVDAGTGDEAVERAREFVLATDAAYAARVQQAVRDRVRERAGALGMTVESETVDADRAVTLVLNVGGSR